jgi:hypothetical protein
MCWSKENPPKRVWGYQAMWAAFAASKSLTYLLRGKRPLNAQVFALTLARMAKSKRDLQNMPQALISSSSAITISVGAGEEQSTFLDEP